MQVKLLFEPRDLWIGVYWDLKHSFKKRETGIVDLDRLEIYICIIPMLPVRISLEWYPRETH